MAAGRLFSLSILLLAITLAVGGCEQLEPLRQGVISNYHKELRQLGQDVNKDGLAKDGKTDQQPADSPANVSNDMAQATHWQPPSLVGAVQLKAPVPFAPETAIAHN